MKTTDDILMTIDQLAAEAAASLGNVDQASGRVSGVPTPRTIRYYGQHGLLDRPVRFDGRTALYGGRHLHQLLAIKHLQARGLSLTEIQAQMLGATDEHLRHLAGLDEAGETPRPSQEALLTRDAFWDQDPAEPTEPTRESSAIEAPMIGVRLDDDVALLLENLPRDLHEDDLEAIRVAAGPLLKVLKTRHLLNSRS